jgi:hypothetical protein
MLVNILLIFFLLLILYQIFLANFNIIEGLENNSAKTKKEEEKPIAELNKKEILDILKTRVADFSKKLAEKRTKKEETEKEETKKETEKEETKKEET